MPVLTVTFPETDPVLPSLVGKTLIEVTEPMEAAVLKAGMVSGAPSLVLAIRLPDGTVAVAQTSAKLFCALGRAIQAKYPEFLD